MKTSKILDPSRCRSSMFFWDWRGLSHYHIIHCDVKGTNLYVFVGSSTEGCAWSKVELVCFPGWPESLDRTKLSKWKRRVLWCGCICMLLLFFGCPGLASCPDCSRLPISRQQAGQWNFMFMVRLVSNTQQFPTAEDRCAKQFVLISFWWAAAFYNYIIWNLGLHV